MSLLEANRPIGSPHPASGRRLERDIDGNGDPWMAAAVHVIPVIDVFHINVVGFVPGACPVTLTGSVDTERQRDLALRIAQSYAGRRKIVGKIKIQGQA